MLFYDLNASGKTEIGVKPENDRIVIFVHRNGTTNANRHCASSAFYSIPTRGFLEETQSSNQFSGSLLLLPFLRQSVSLFSFPFFHRFFMPLSLIVRSILCRARPEWTQITYRRFHFNIGSQKRKKKEERARGDVSRDWSQWRVAQDNNNSTYPIFPRASTCCDSGFLYHRISAVKNGHEFQAQLVTSIVRVELFEKQLSIRGLLSFPVRKMFHVTRSARYFQRGFSSGNRANGSLSSAKFPLDCHFNAFQIKFQFIVFVAWIHSPKIIRYTFFDYVFLVSNINHSKDHT